MAQQNEQSHSFDPATVPTKRKRGRPRKEDAPGTEPSGRTRRRRDPPPTTSQDLVGQPVSGILDGVFDTGFLITVRVSNNGPLLKGMVFDSRIAVPITAANDIAPHIKMSKRDEIPIPSAPISAEPLQRRDPPVLSRIADRVLANDGSDGSALRSKCSEDVIYGAPSAVSKEAVKVGGDQMQGLTGAPKLDSTNKASLDNKTANDLKADSTTQMSPRPPVSESDTKDRDDSGQPKASIPEAATCANSEILQEIKTSPVGNGSIQMPPGEAA